MAKKFRLTCGITEEAGKIVTACARMIEFKKGAKTKAVRVLMYMAFDTPTAETSQFFGSDTETISVEVPQEDLVNLEGYMGVHSHLNERRKGFKSAVLRGCGIFQNSEDKQALVDVYKERLGFFPTELD